MIANLTLRSRNLAGVGACIVLLLAAPQIAAAESTSVQGMISHRDGSKITVTSADGTNTVVTVTDSTRVVSVAGKLGLQKNDAAVSDLINGLPVNIDTVQNGDEIDAVKVSYKTGDMKTARQVEAGTAQAKANVRAKAAELQAQNDDMRKRLSEANQYVQKAETTVTFASGSIVLSAAAKASLRDIAAQAQGIKGYLVSVVGYADPTGNPDANQRLSQRRAAAVTQYLQKYCGVTPQRVIAPDAMGDAHLIGDSTTASGLAQNRRVVVKVLTNKGLEGL